MPSIAKIVSMPLHPEARYAIVSDGYGVNRSVAIENLPLKAKADDEFAYHLDFSKTKGGEQVLVPEED